MYDLAIIGGGIVGLATAHTLAHRLPGKTILLLEKEAGWAAHQTGRNSGVIHSGIYYKPGSLKARLAREGNRSMVEFCERRGIPYEVCGKLIAATEESELPLLERLYQRGIANGLAIERLRPEEAREIEPHVRARAALRVPSTGIANYRQVAECLAAELGELGGTPTLGARVKRIVSGAHSAVLETTQGDFEANFVINCAGLHSDRVASSDGGEALSAKIVPFRGEYYELKPESRHLVKHLIYPVPNPQFPFLGVHFTRMIDGSIHAGPNAVLSLKREGYSRTSCNLRDAFDTLTYPGFWRLAAQHWRDGMQEVHRSFSKAAFVRSLQRLVPAIQADDLLPSQAGVRAQALEPSGALVDDFLIVERRRSMHVLNAPSPAATASLQIAAYITDRVAGEKLSAVREQRLAFSD
jgi:(S)-2-hydroxyglutarate dehydrogenase